MGMAIGKTWCYCFIIFWLITLAGAVGKGVEEKSAGEKGEEKQEEEQEIDMVFSVVVNFRKWLLTCEKRKNKSLVKITTIQYWMLLGWTPR